MACRLSRYGVSFLQELIQLQGCERQDRRNRVSWYSFHLSYGGFEFE